MSKGRKSKKNLISRKEDEWFRAISFSLQTKKQSSYLQKCFGNSFESLKKEIFSEPNKREFVVDVINMLEDEIFCKKVLRTNFGKVQNEMSFFLKKHGCPFTKYPHDFVRVYTGAYSSHGFIHHSSLGLLCFGYSDFRMGFKLQTSYASEKWGAAFATSVYSPTVHPLFSGVEILKIATCESGTLYLTPSYVLVSGDFVELGDTVTPTPRYHHMIEGMDIVDIACGKRTTWLINKKGKVLTSGHSSNGMCGIGSDGMVMDETVRELTEVRIDDPIKSVAAAEQHSVFLSFEGKCFVCGNCKYIGQVPSPEYGFGDNITVTNPGEFITTPVELSFSAPVVSIGCGNCCSLFLLDDGRLHLSGELCSNGLKFQKDGDSDDEEETELVGEIASNIKEFKIGAHHIFLRQRNNDNLHALGYGLHGRLGTGVEKIYDEPQQILQEYSPRIVVDYTPGQASSYFILDNFEILACGKGYRGSIPDGIQEGIGRMDEERSFSQPKRILLDLEAIAEQKRIAEEKTKEENEVRLENIRLKKEILEVKKERDILKMKVGGGEINPEIESLVQDLRRELDAMKSKVTLAAEEKIKTLMQELETTKAKLKEQEGYLEEKMSDMMSEQEQKLNSLLKGRDEKIRGLMQERQEQENMEEMMNTLLKKREVEVEVKVNGLSDQLVEVKQLVENELGELNAKNDAVKEFVENRLGELNSKNEKQDKIIEGNRDTIAQIAKELKIKKRELMIKFESIAKGRELGRGAYGTVYAGSWINEGGGTEIAVKEIRLKEGCEIATYLTEFKMVAKCHHPLVLSVFGYSLNPERTAMLIVMERLNTDLHTYILNNRRTLSIENKLDLMKKTTQCIHYLHEKVKIIHRDIKTPNFLMNEGGSRIAVTDFGLAKTFETISASFIEASSVGTERCMAPEILNVRGKYSKKSDVYALGMTFYEILTGIVPWEKELRARSIRNVVFALCVEKKRPAFVDSVPNVCKELVRACWCEDPKKRLSTGEILEKIEEIHRVLWEEDVYMTNV